MTGEGDVKGSLKLLRGSGSMPDEGAAEYLKKKRRENLRSIVWRGRTMIEEGTDSLTSGMMRICSISSKGGVF